MLAELIDSDLFFESNLKFYLLNFLANMLMDIAEWENFATFMLLVEIAE